jgi:hypothetical protein
MCYDVVSYRMMMFMMMIMRKTMIMMSCGDRDLSSHFHTFPFTRFIIIMHGGRRNWNWKQTEYGIHSNENSIITIILIYLVLTIHWSGHILFGPISLSLCVCIVVCFCFYLVELRQHMSRDDRSYTRTTQYKIGLLMTVIPNTTEC